MKVDIANGLVLFGGTGDLAKRKLVPAIYNLLIDDLLPHNFFVVAVGRREKTTEEFVDELKEAIEEFSRNKLEEEKWNRIAKCIYYYKLDFTKGEGYKELDNNLKMIEDTHSTMGNRIFYLAVSPEAFGTIVENLEKFGLTNNEKGYKRVVIEKPFGKDLESAKRLNNQISKVFNEDSIYRIDHYLGKEMLQNIMVIRFANAAFEPIWNSQHIDHVQITSSETLGVDGRGGYYEKAGALKDMVQNHMLQFLSLIAMEPPEKIDTESIRDEKVKVLKSLGIYNKDEVYKNVVRGQYDTSEDNKTIAYRDEARTDSNSNTETYVALKININNERWMGVPFYIRTGKRMKKKGVQAVIQFKAKYKSNYYELSQGFNSNQLIISIQPKEGINFRFNAKKPGEGNDIIPVNMDFCQNCMIGYNSQEAYERLLLDVMKGDKTLFTRWDEVENSWRFIDSVNNAWKDKNTDFPNYDANTFGPKAADELLQRDDREWMNDY